MLRAPHFTAALIFFFVTSCSAPAAPPHPLPEDPRWLTYEGGAGPGSGKHIVLIAADQEYRSEQSLPMLARTLSEHHGFHCTVLFSLNDEGLADPTKKIRWEDKEVSHDIPGIEHLQTADLMILFSRLITLPEEQLAYIYEYLIKTRRGVSSSRRTARTPCSRGSKISGVRPMCTEPMRRAAACRRAACRSSWANPS